MKQYIIHTHTATYNNINILYVPVAIIKLHMHGHEPYIHYYTLVFKPLSSISSVEDSDD